MRVDGLDGSNQSARRLDCYAESDKTVMQGLALGQHDRAVDRLGRGSFGDGGDILRVDRGNLDRAFQHDGLDAGAIGQSIGADAGVLTADRSGDLAGWKNDLAYRLLALSTIGEGNLAIRLEGDSFGDLAVVIALQGCLGALPEFRGAEGGERSIGRGPVSEEAQKGAADHHAAGNPGHASG